MGAAPISTGKSHQHRANGVRTPQNTDLMPFMSAKSLYTYTRCWEGWRDIIERDQEQSGRVVIPSVGSEGVSSRA